MTDIKSRLSSVTDRESWAARRATFVTKVTATKAVWFPPKPVESGKKAASAAKKTTGAAKKKSAAKTTSGTKKVTSPVRRKKT